MICLQANGCGENKSALKKKITNVIAHLIFLSIAGMNTPIMVKVTKSNGKLKTSKPT